MMHLELYLTVQLAKSLLFLFGDTCLRLMSIENLFFDGNFYLTSKSARKHFSSYYF